jgi:glycosyltransferase involved in cell wall biosynthesis
MPWSKWSNEAPNKGLEHNGMRCRTNERGAVTLSQDEIGLGKLSTMEDKVSVVLPTHDRPERLVRAIGSALNQTYGNLEVIVVDDASQIDVRPIVEGIHDPRLKFIRLDQNQGAPGARNVGIKEATGRYVAFLDDDDEWMPEKLELQVADLRMKAGRFKASYCIREFYDDDRMVVVGRSKTGWNGDHLKAFLTGSIVPSTSCVLAEKACLDEVGGFRKDLPRLQDRELWLRLSEHYDFAFVDRVLVRMHLHKAGRISDNLPALMRSYAIIYASNKRVFMRHPRSRGVFLLNWGYESLEAGEDKMARKLFIRSMASFPFNKAPYVALGSMILKRPNEPSYETEAGIEQ